MGKLMKYEFRKTMFSKAVLLVITALGEIFYLFGGFLKWEKGLGIGVMGLGLCASGGIFYIGIESLLIWHRDLNTKQSYMLFLPPGTVSRFWEPRCWKTGFPFSWPAYFSLCWR